MARPDLLQEASDPTTAPERLRELTHHEDEAVRRAAIRNPSLPEEAWRQALLRGWPEAWANPMAPLYLLAWTPHKDDPSILEQGARWAMEALWRNPEQCSTEGKALLAAKVQAWWATYESGTYMLRFIGWWARAKGTDSIGHREALRIVVVCVRTEPDLTERDRQALDLLDAWTAGSADRRNEANDLADSEAVKQTCRFARAPAVSPWSTINRSLPVIVFAHKEAEAEHDRMLADLIRREMPFAPSAE